MNKDTSPDESEEEREHTTEGIGEKVRERRERAESAATATKQNSLRWNRNNQPESHNKAVCDMDI